jgi:hypothetical protein
LFLVPTATTPDFTIAPASDGQRFLILESSQSDQPAPVTVVVNWTAELK